MRKVSQQKNFSRAVETYAELGMDVKRAMQRLPEVHLSLHCWQGDDVNGFENSGQELGAGLAVTGNYLGRACSPNELRQDLAKVFSLVPGNHRLNLHAIYAETGKKKVERDELGPEHFRTWLSWAQSNGIGLDFNPTFFSHPKATEFTLTHWDYGVRHFWIRHGIACRKIAASFGDVLGTPAICNIWIPDGMKDTPVDRLGPRQRLTDSLDQILRETFDQEFLIDAVEPKLFGIGTESYVAGSHEFYLGYAVRRDITMCLDAGHYHPTEGIADKISSVLLYLKHLLLHVSRGVRWDSDHVVILDDALRAIAEELVRGDFLSRTYIGLDYFDASINRIAAYVVGTRAMLKALLIAMLEPTGKLQEMEVDGDYTGRLLMLERLKMMPFGAVWDQYCLETGVPLESELRENVAAYEKSVLAKRRK